MKKKDLEKNLIIGAQIRLGKEYCFDRHGFKPGDVITLVEGEFEHDNGLYTETQYAPSIWNEDAKEFDSIYHLFGNDLDEFADCEIINADANQDVGVANEGI